MYSTRNHKHPNPLSDLQMISIVRTVSNYFNTNPDDVIGRSKRGETLDARMYVVGILRLHHGLSLRQIGELLSNRDHSTVIHIYKKFMGMRTCKVKHMREEAEEIYSKLIDQKI
jgi:chromosomal replication initiation ATPase DnaA